MTHQKQIINVFNLSPKRYELIFISQARSITSRSCLSVKNRSRFDNLLSHARHCGQLRAGWLAGTVPFNHPKAIVIEALILRCTKCTLGRSLSPIDSNHGVDLRRAWFESSILIFEYLFFIDWDYFPLPIEVKRLTPLNLKVFPLFLQLFREVF